MPKLIDINELCKDLPEVYNAKPLDRKRFSPGGLFSQQIFGPIKNYTCQCGTYYGPSKGIEKCKVCDVEIVHSKERRRRFAKIILPVPVVNPIFYDLLDNLAGNNLKTQLDLLMYNEKSAVYIDKTGEEEIVVAPDDADKYKSPRYKKFEKTEGIYELVKHISYNFKDIPNWRYVYNNLDKLILREILVLPPDLRPVLKMSLKENKIETDTINSFYGHILTKKVSMRETLLEIFTNKKLYYEYLVPVQKDVIYIYDHIIKKLSKKEGLIRGNILGKRSDFSGRAVIVPDPTLVLDECCLPYFAVLELFKIQIAKRLVELEKFKFINNAIDHIDRCIEVRDTSLIKVCEEIVKGEVCLLNRQPSLHRLGLLGFKIKVTLGDVIRIHPLVCAGYNADFDGDQMAIYLPITKETKDEVREKFLSTKNLFSPTDAALSTIPSQDIVIGIYILTNNMIPYLTSEVECKGKKITEGQKIFNECLPKDYTVIDYTVKKKELLKILGDINEKYSPEETTLVLDKIKEVGFTYSTIYGVSLSLKDIVSESLNEYRDEIYKKKSSREQLDILSSKDTEEFLRKGFKYSYLIDSGARGSWDQARQIIFSRGYVSNFKGDILPTPVKGNLLDGLNPTEFFLSTHGARKGLLDTALNTGVSGYLSRKLIFTCANLQKDLELEDCGTTDYLSVYVSNEKKARMLIMRWYKNPETKVEELITRDNYLSFVGKTILIRSPIYCRSEKICHKCYGDLYKILHSKFIGIIAAEALGEVGVQLVLRNFHTSLSSNTKILDVNNKSYEIKDVYNIVKSGDPFYTFSCSPEGEIVVSKVIDAHKDRFEKKMIRVTLDNNEFVECTLDHEWIMRNGKHKKAESLVAGDSLMPIYIDDSDLYRKVKQNIERRPNQTGNYSSDLIYHLSSNHCDCINKCDENTKTPQRHHINEDKRDDYPSNLEIIPIGTHISIHGIKAIQEFNTSEAGKLHHENLKSIVSESNKRRCEDPEFVERMYSKRQETMLENDSYALIGRKVAQLCIDDPERGARLIEAARITTINIIINTLKEKELELTNENYEFIRKSFGDKGKHYITFDFAHENYPELVEDFSIIERPEKHKNQLASESRMNKIVDFMKENDYEMTYGNFDKVNHILYPFATGFTHREKLLQWSPEYLIDLKDIDGERYITSDTLKSEITGKSRNYLQCQSRLDTVIEKMKELEYPMTCTMFEKANEIVYPNVYSRRKLVTLLKECPEYSSCLMTNHKVVKVEIIDLPQEEEFYDLTVDSKYPNFALGAGIFIHNSGVAQVKETTEEIENEGMRQEDIIGDLATVSKILHVKDKNMKETELVDALCKVYSESREIHHVHFESVIAQLMWIGSIKWRLHPKRSEIPPTFFSIQSVPERESWLLGLGFASPKKNIIRGLLKNGNYTGIFDSILLGKRI